MNEKTLFWFIIWSHSINNSTQSKQPDCVEPKTIRPLYKQTAFYLFHCPKVFTHRLHWLDKKKKTSSGDVLKKWFNDWRMVLVDCHWVLESKVCFLKFINSWSWNSYQVASKNSRNALSISTQLLQTSCLEFHSKSFPKYKIEPNVTKPPNPSKIFFCSHHIPAFTQTWQSNWWISDSINFVFVLTSLTAFRIHLFTGPRNEYFISLDHSQGGENVCFFGNNLNL